MSANRKVLIVGDKRCGKRTLLSAFKYDQFMPDHDESIDNTYTANIPIDGKTVPIDIELQNPAIIEECFYYIKHPNLNRIVNVAIICFSIDNPDSLINANEKWIQKVRHYYNRCSIILVACKIDLRTDPENVNENLITSEDGRQFATEIKADVYIECSAKNGTGVQDLFIQAARLARKRRSNKTSCICCFLQ